MNELRKVMVVGAALGIADRLAAMFPDPQRHQEKELTDADRKAIVAAQAKRERRAEKLRAGGDA